MAVSNITYSNKVALNENPSVADINKVKADDMNEIKSVVNNNATETSNNTNAIVNLQTYSTDEVNTGKTWIDQKPIYRKSIYINSFPNVAEKNVAHGITNISQILDIYGYATDGSRTFPLPFISINLTTGNASGSIYITVNSTNVTLGTASNRSAFSGYVTLEYTKTTD